MKESIKIIIYQENDKTKIKLKNKNKKNAPEGVRNLHLLLNDKIKTILNTIK